MRFFFTAAIVVAFVVNSYAGKDFKADLGKVSKDELKMTHCPIDSSASASILFDIGRSEVKYIIGTGFVKEFRRHVRIKIFNKEGYDQANIEIPLYQSGNDKEKLVQFKGYTHNLEGNSAEKEKVTKGDGNSEEVNKHWYVEKFTMPDVKEGSVIEYEYTINSPFLFELQDWQMQYTIPVMRSDYTAVFPEYFWYNKQMRGSVALAVNDYSTEMFRDQGTYKTESKVYNETGMTDIKTGTIEYRNHVFHLVSENVPGLREEPYMPDIDNYFAEISFELAYTEFPGETRENYTKTWKDINRLLLDDEEFGTQLGRSGYAKDFIDPLIAAGDDELTKAVLIFEYIRDRMKWNGLRGIYVTSSLRSAYKERSGNSADINLMIVSLLREAGIESYPVLVSTRDNGFVRLGRPSITQFNYVIAVAKIGGVDYFLDATDPDYPFAMLPERCINGQGRIINEQEGDWITVNPAGNRKEVISGNLSVSEEGVLTGKLSKIKSEYSAIGFREDVSKANNIDDFIAGMSSKNPGLTIHSYQMENLDSLAAPVKVEYDIELENYSHVAGDFIYLEPMITEKIDENPFKPDTRIYPVDIIYPNEQIIVMNITLPEGYAVESLPEATAIRLPEKGGMFLYNCNQMGNTISVTCRLVLGKPIYMQSEYPYIKEFFNQVVSKQAEQIVLKKRT